MFVNLAYYVVLDVDVVMASTSIAMVKNKKNFLIFVQEFGNTIFNPTLSSKIIPIIVILSTLGSIHSSIFTGSRLIHQTASLHHIPVFFSLLHTKTKTPVYALSLQAGLSVVFVWIGDFKGLVMFYSLVVWIFYSGCVVGVGVLRYTEPW